MPPEAVRACGYIQSFSPREELADFLMQRGECWMQERNYFEATEAYAWANELDPAREQHRLTVLQALRSWDEQIKGRLPSRQFPKLDVRLPPQRLTHMPREVEREWICLQIMQRLLDDPEHEARWWGPMRRDPTLRPPGLPRVMSLDFHWMEMPTYYAYEPTGGRR